METLGTLKWGLRLFFWLAMTGAINQGSLFGMALCGIGFLIMEYFVEDLEQNL